jgi:hypothetical protein
MADRHPLTVIRYPSSVNRYPLGRSTQGKATSGERKRQMFLLPEWLTVIRYPLTVNRYPLTVIRYPLGRNRGGTGIEQVSASVGG